VTTRSTRGPVERPVAGAPGAPPLWLPDEPFPPYRFVPGQAPHPAPDGAQWRTNLRSAAQNRLTSITWPHGAETLVTWSWSAQDPANHFAISSSDRWASFKVPSLRSCSHSIKLPQEDSP